MANAGGRGMRTLLTATQIVQDPSFSPDGRFIVYEDDRKDPDIYVLDLRSPGDPHRITPSDLADDAPVWSPDGTRILYTADHPTGRQATAARSSRCDPTARTRGD